MPADGFTRESTMRARIVAAVLCGLIGIATIPTAHAQSPQAAMSIAADLGVGLDELVACTGDARDRAEAPKGTDERKAEMQTLVLTCLQQTRPDLTAQQFAAVVAKYR
jgi:hypothetical protein